MSSKNKSRLQSFWDQRRGTIYSHKGGAKLAQGVVYSHGHSILDDLVGNITYTQMIVLNATGRIPERRVADWIEAAYICLSWPDSRIWCNQIGALCGTLQASTVAGTAAGMLAADSTMYGTLPLIEGVKFIQSALQMRNKGLSVSNIVDAECARFHGRPRIIGYARPIARGDERIVALERVRKTLGFDIGSHLTLAYEIQDVLFSRFEETMNGNGFASAFLSDQGYTPSEVYRLSAMCVNSGVMACYINAVGQAPEGFLPMQCEDVEYGGTAPRSVPDK